MAMLLETRLLSWLLHLLFLLQRARIAFISPWLLARVQSLHLFLLLILRKGVVLPDCLRLFAPFFHDRLELILLLLRQV